ncbi:MAG TPA: universal stress protein [Stellaceae bacterium]|nr:universal stress protein [Stellaceae bacterium]
MTIKTILVAASGGSATGGAVDLACRLAQRFRAHLEGYHVLLDPQAALAALGDGVGLGLTSTLIESMIAEAQIKAAETRSLFDQILARREIAVGNGPHPVECRASACWREEAGYAPALVANRARFFDLAVLGRSERVVGEPYTDTIEQVLASSGRPVLLAPADAPPTFGKTIAIAWNGSPQAVRALAAGLPFLASAEAVWLITAGPDDGDRAASAVEYLAWHGISARHRDLPDRPGRHVGRVLLEAAYSNGADLLVMGGYGHAPWRELVLGGATREALGRMTMPILLVH